MSRTATQDPHALFKVGGTLHLNAPSYVKRPADDELLAQVLAGHFCYVLSSRQMGKSSLMLRTAEQLNRRNIQTAIVDLSGVGTQGITSQQWYLGILNRIGRGLKLQTDAEAWWQANAGLTAVQRFTDFLHDVVLAETQNQVVIFIDEIDSTLKLPFTDDFFAAIRFVYNRRASQPEYDRLTFVLLGVATPTDLIRDRSRTPFNIGQAIHLQEISWADAHPLRQALNQLYPGQGEPLLERVFYWTGGHPYLTQKLCLATAEAANDRPPPALVDALVEQSFFAEEAKKEDNLQFVRSNIQKNPERRRLMQLYDKVYRGEVVPEDERSPHQNRLRLIGLVKVENNRLQVRNEIYRRVFDQAFIRNNMPVDWTQRITWGALAVSAAVIIFLLWFIPRQQQQALDTAIQSHVESFHRSANADIRLKALANLCAIDQQPEAGRLFWALSAQERVDMFDRVKAEGAKDNLKRTVACLHPSLAEYEADVAARRRLSQAMCCALHRWKLDEAEAFANETGASCTCQTGAEINDD